MQTKKQKLKKLEKMKYDRKTARKFFLMVKKISPKNKKEPLFRILRGKKVYPKYIYTTNTKNKFTIRTRFTSKMKRYHYIPVHIDNKITGKKHLNILQIKGKTVTRFDPSYPLRTHIVKIDKSLKKYFKKYNLNYRGIDKRNKFMKHGGLCRYITPLLVIHGKKLNYKLAKSKIIDLLR